MILKKTLLLIIVLSCRIIFSHPHLFMDASAKFIINDTGLEGIYTYWEMDEMNSTMVMDFYDKNKTGVLDKKELIELLKYTLTNIQKVTTINYGLKFISIDKVTKFNAVLNEKKKLVYSFFIPCAIPYSKLKNKELTFMLSDPSMFIAFVLKKKLIQVNTNDHFKGTIKFRVVDYADAVIFELKRK